MLQDIAPHRFRNEFKRKEPLDTDYVLITNGNKILSVCSSEIAAIPRYCTVQAHFPAVAESSIYLFSIDKISFYLSTQDVAETGHFYYYDVQIFSSMEPVWMTFALATASHLAHWYSTHQYCGRCATDMVHSVKERAMCCPSCGITEYPKISPVVIVAIADGDRLLMTKYANAGYKKYALIAGFSEIGETLEDTIHREVMEEVGLRVCNLRYYKSQPWAYSESLLMGFFADLDGDGQPTLDQQELSEAVWFSRDEIPMDDSTLSLSWDMIEAFRNKEI